MTVSLISDTGISLGRQSGSAKDENTSLAITYILYLSSPYESQIDIQNSGLVPTKGQSHPFNPLAKCTYIDSDRLKGNLWYWTCDFETFISQEKQERRTITNPLNRPIRWRIVPQHDKRVVEKNIEGIALTNSAGDPTFPLPEVPRTYAVFHGVKNVAAIPGWYRDLADKLNSDSFQIAQYNYTASPKTLLFEPGEVSDVMTDNGVDYFQINFRLIDKESWAWKRLDRGFYFIDEDDVKKRILVDGEWPDDPVLLDGEGGVLDNPKGVTAIELEDDIIEAMPFSLINLP